MRSQSLCLLVHFSPAAFESLSTNPQFKPNFKRDGTERFSHVLRQTATSNIQPQTFIPRRFKGSPSPLRPPPPPHTHKLQFTCFTTSKESPPPRSPKAQFNPPHPHLHKFGPLIVTGPDWFRCFFCNLHVLGHALFSQNGSVSGTVTGLFRPRGSESPQKTRLSRHLNLPVSRLSRLPHQETKTVSN